MAAKQIDVVEINGSSYILAVRKVVEGQAIAIKSELDNRMKIWGIVSVHRAGDLRDQLPGNHYHPDCEIIGGPCTAEVVGLQGPLPGTYAKRIRTLNELLENVTRV